MWQRTSGPSRTLDLVSCHWCPLEMPLSLLLCCPFPADEGHQEGRVGSVSQSGMCSFEATWSPLHLCQPFSSPRGGGSMMCWDVLQDFLVGSKAEGGRGGQGLPVEPPGSPATVCPKVSAPVLCTSHQEAQLGTGRARAALVCFLFSAQKRVMLRVMGGTAGAGDSLALTSHHSLSLLSIRQDNQGRCQ